MADRVISLFDGMIADDAPLPAVPQQPVTPAAAGVLELRG
jgi:hypothetical protein